MIGNNAPHELPNGVVLEGTAASVARALDSYDPLRGDERLTMTESQTLDELCHWLHEVRWCEEVGRAIVPAERDMWREADERELRAMVMAFLSARVKWADAAFEATGDDPDLNRLAKAYRAFAHKADGTVMASRMVEAFKTVRHVSATELNRGRTSLGSPHGVLSLDDLSVRADTEDAVAIWTDSPASYSLRRLNTTKSVRATVPADFTPDDLDPECRWARFVDEICDGDVEKAAFLQRALGYSLLGGNPEKATFVLWGPTRDNGKSTLMNAVKHALGDYADTAPAGLLLVNRNESYTQANPVLARLPGKRLVDVSEPPAGAELNGAMVKKLASGQDEISCRQLHREEFTYVPDFTIWMHCNALPVVRDASAIDPRHMFVIEFTRSFGPDERDPRLWEELTSEEGATDVMEWLLVGYQEWRERGLDAPRSVTDATVAWLRTSGTWLDRFLEEECVLGSDKRCPIPLMKAAMTAWTEENDVDMLSMYKVNKYLEQRTVTRGKSGDVRYYAGIDLLPTTLTKYALADGDSCPTKKGSSGRVKLR